MVQTEFIEDSDQQPFVGLDNHRGRTIELVKSSDDESSSNPTLAARVGTCRGVALSHRAHTPKAKSTPP